MRAQSVPRRARAASLLALLVILFATTAAALASGVDQGPEPTVTPGADETPIVDPQPQPLPVYLPCAARRADRALPPPLLPDARGFVASLSRTGREACSPATHVLLAEREGTSPNSAAAVVYASPRNPEINLDLYVSDFVVVSGLEDNAPTACSGVTRRLIEVRAVRVVPVPPGQSPALFALSGNLTSTAME
jgi:hypothetical protein